MQIYVKMKDKSEHFAETICATAKNDERFVETKCSFMVLRQRKVRQGCLRTFPDVRPTRRPYAFLRRPYETGLLGRHFAL